MTPEAVYMRLRQAGAAACEPFDGHVLACIFTSAIGECGPHNLLPSGLGIGGSELRRAIDRYFPGTLAQLEPLGLDAEPVLEEDERCLRELLWRFRTAASPLDSLLAKLISRRATRPNHLWQDLGLLDRGELSTLMQRHFELLARRNTEDMKWKKFFFRMICRDESYRLCAAPSCSECTDFNACFGDESGESLLARVRLIGEVPGLVSLEPARLH